MSRKTRERAAIRVAAEKKKKTRRNIIKAAVAAVVLTGVGYSVGTYITSPVDARGTATWDTAAIHATDIVYGDSSAPVRVTEYASLTCHHCSNFHERELPTFLKDYVDTGKVQLVLRHFPFDAPGFAGAQALSCLPNARRVEAIKTMMANQPKWIPAESPAAAALDLLDLTSDERIAVNDCIARDTHSKAIGEIAFEARNHGIESTPTFVIGDKVYPGYMSSEALGRVVEAAARAK